MATDILRLGHRYVRDDRATTHLFLAARALGADTALYSGQRDSHVEESIRKVNETWGGSFEVKHVPSWAKALEDYRARGWKVVHLTMYGMPLQSVIDEVRSSSADKVVVVGGPKVPKGVYELADWNVAVTNQPHSEISALGVFLHELSRGAELSKPFQGGELEIVPQPRGKLVRKKALAQGSGEHPKAG